MIAILGLVLGIILGILLDPTIPYALQPYLPIAVVAAMDALLGGARAWFEGKFSDRVFITSFFWNVLIAALLVLVGAQLGVGAAMTTAIVVVLGIRVFSNAAAIRRHIFGA